MKISMLINYAAHDSNFLCRAKWHFAHNEAALRSTTLKFLVCQIRTTR